MHLQDIFNKLTLDRQALACAFPDKKAYCFVCDKDEPWSDKCQIKLNSDDVSLDYDRYTTGPTYQGPEISNANAQELWRLQVVV